MFKTNIFSGETYWEDKNTKISTSGNIFTKSGSTWLGSNGEQIQKIGNQEMNLRTGVMSSFGDPFKEEK